MCVQLTLERDGVVEKRVEKRTLVEEDETDHDKVCCDGDDDETDHDKVCCDGDDDETDHDKVCCDGVRTLRHQDTSAPVPKCLDAGNFRDISAPI